MMNQSYTREILKTVVAQIAQTIGWHAIQTTPLELLIDILHRYLEDVSKLTHRYSEQFGQTQPNLDHLGLAFQDLGIDLQELGDYVRNVEPVPCAVDVPQYPVARETHLNFLKPGSHEVVHRPVHVHEHLPPMHPDMEDPGKKTQLSTETPSASNDGSISGGNVFKRPGDPLETPAMKRTRLMLEEEGRPLREISSVIMTTSGFLSPAREGKLPEARVPSIPSDTNRHSPTPSSFPTVPPEVKSEKKIKKIPSKKTAVLSKKLEKSEQVKKKSKDSGKAEKIKTKKLAAMKETNKLKALKTKAKKNLQPAIGSEGNPKDFASFLQNLMQKTHPSKKPEEPVWHGPGPSKELGGTEKSAEANVPEGKLSAEPDKQKLNIFKKISKVKEEKDKNDREDMPREPRETPQSAVSEQAGDKPWSSTVSDRDEEEIYISDDLSPPGTPSTPRTPEMPSKSGGKKKKKDKSKSKSKSKSLSKKIKPEMIDLEEVERPKTPETPHVPIFPFATHFPPVPGLIPPPLPHPLFPNLPFMKGAGPSGMQHPAMPNLPIPPAGFMQAAPTPQPVLEEAVETTPEPVPSPTVIKPVEKEKEKKPKETKKDKDEKKTKKKKLKKDKLKNKEKSEKKKEEKKKDKEKAKEKKEKKKDREKEERPEGGLIPKLTLKLGPDSSRPSTPEQSRKIVIKPVVKKEEVSTASEPKRAASPELARISALITRQPKQKSKSSEVESEPKPESLKVKEPKRPSFPIESGSSKETVAFYHHAPASGPGPAGKARSPRGPAAAQPSKTAGDDEGNKVWICPACKGPDDGSPMIGCDDCDAWYHWVCVGIQVPPDDKEDWYCRECIHRKQGAFSDKKKKFKKKKIQ